MEFKGIIFDLDGTLLDSMHCWENVDRSFLLENEITPPEGISDIVKKMTIQDSAMYFKTQFKLKQSCEDIINRVEEMVREHYFNTIQLKNGGYELIHEFKKMGYRLCVATATYKSLAEAALKRLGIYECFDSLLTCSDIGAGKDKPDIYIKSAEKMGCDIKNTLVIEDSLHCIETAENSGFKTIAVYDEVSANEWNEICSKAWKNVKDLSEISDLLRKDNI